MQQISPRLAGAVAIGGAIGSVSRLLLGDWLNHEFLSLMLANLIGSFLIGAISQFTLSEMWQRCLKTGALGAFTSMSAVIVLISPDLGTTESVMAILITFLFAPISVSLGKRIFLGRQI